MDLDQWALPRDSDRLGALASASQSAGEIGARVKPDSFLTQEVLPVYVVQTPPPVAFVGFLEALPHRGRPETEQWFLTPFILISNGAPDHL